MPQPRSPPHSGCHHSSHCIFPLCISKLRFLSDQQQQVCVCEMLDSSGRGDADEGAQSSSRNSSSWSPRQMRVQELLSQKRALKFHKQK